jgi:ATP-dependent exoDNAse (exonuclease V) alpha subunit
MNVRIVIGKGVTGAVRYCLGEGRHPLTGELLPRRADGRSRVEWIGGTGFSFPIRTLADVERARLLMELDAQNQPVRRGGWRCEQDCVHLVLSWRPGEQPTRNDIEMAAKDALAALGMENAKALFFVHNDEDYAHIHIVASKINPATGRAYDLKGNYLILSRWAEQYEREHGGIINLRRADMNELRAAIRDRDAAAVLEGMTRQRPTITEDQLRRALQKEIYAARGTSPEHKRRVEADRTQFQARILAHPDVIRLREETPNGPAIRYTTRSVLEAEQHVLRAAAELAGATGHDVGDACRVQIEGSATFATMTPEQLHAFRHVTAAKGLALIDGQAGTGKSYTIAAIRAAYETAGYRVIGLAPTNAVAEDMRNDGFGHAGTIHAELFALANGRRTWTRDTAVIVDEAAMVETTIMALVARWAAESGAKLILAGDDRQLSSINRGGMFAVLKDRHGAATLSAVKRQYKIDERRASEMMAEGNFHDALGIYQQKGSLHWTRTQPEARALLVEQWANDNAAAPDKSRFVFAYTNDAVRDLNAALRAVRQNRGELGPDRLFETAHGPLQFAVGDRLQFTASDKPAGIANGRAGTIEAIDGTHLTIRLDGRKPKTIQVDAAAFTEFRHGYAGTIYAGQGKTLQQTYLYHSEHWRSAPSYVALTRHKKRTDLFVARNTAADLSQLARQMARTDERRAASMFQLEQPLEPVPALTAAELSAKFTPVLARRERQASIAKPVEPIIARAVGDIYGRYTQTEPATGGDPGVHGRDRHRPHSRQARQGRGSPALAGFPASSSNR